MHNTQYHKYYKMHSAPPKDYSVTVQTSFLLEFVPLSFSLIKGMFL